MLFETSGNQNQWRCNVHIIRNADDATLTFVPVSPEEIETVGAIVEILSPEDHIRYGGRTGGENGEPLSIFLHAGSESVRKSDNPSPTSTVMRTVHEGGIKLQISGTTEEDDQEVWRLRNLCFVGTAGFIYLGATEVDGKIALVCTGSRCQHCQSGMITMSHCEWDTCSACVELCEHTFERGACHANNAIGVQMGLYCTKCGMGKPKTGDEPVLDPLAQIEEVVVETGLLVVDTDTGTLYGPSN